MNWGAAAGRALLLAAGVTLGGCGGAGGCQGIVPRELPDGSAPGPSTQATIDGRVTYVWGTGPSRVSQRVVTLGAGVDAHCALGEVPALDGCFPVDDRTSVRGQPGVLIFVGDAPIAGAIIAFAEGSCAYEVRVGPGLTLEQVADYVPRF